MRETTFTFRVDQELKEEFSTAWDGLAAYMKLASSWRSKIGCRRSVEKS